MTTPIYEFGLPKTPANHAPLTPLSFLERAAAVYPERLAVVHGGLRRTWAQVSTRCRRLASALAALGIRKGDTVAAMLPNTPPMIELHFGVPAIGAVLNALNTRLDADSIAFMLDHGEAKIVFADAEYSETVRVAVAKTGAPSPSSTWTMPASCRVTTWDGWSTRRCSRRATRPSRGGRPTTSGTPSA